MAKLFSVLFVGLALAVVSNLIWLDFQINKILSSPTTPSQTKETIIEKQAASPSALPQQAVSAPTPTPASSTSTSDTFIPMGSGTTKQTIWTDVPSAQVSFSKSDYAGLNHITWQVNLSINPPFNGIAGARLINKTDGYVVEGSTLSTAGQKEGVLQVSGDLDLPSGKKTYQIQMYSSAGYDATANNAYIRLMK